MAVSTFTPIFQTHPSSSSSLESISPSLSRLTIPRTRTLKHKPTSSKTRVSISSPLSILSDPFVLQIAEALEDSLSSSSSSSSPPLQKLRDSSSESLLTTPWPSRRDEPFRFTDTSFIKKSKILPISAPPQGLLSLLGETQFPNLCIVDGYIVNLLSTFSDGGVFVGRLSSLELDDPILKRLSEFESGIEGDLFWSLNGVGAPDVLVVYVPEGVVVEDPLHLRFVSDKGENEGANKLPVSNPRVLVLVEKGGEIGVIEEFVGGDGDKCYWANSVMDVVVGEGAKFSHSYIQNQSLNAAHTKWTSVRQELASTYELIEVSTGGKLSRHNLHVQQVGSDTVTELSTFHLSASDQTQDLHSRLILDHPRGKSRQLHKCIVAHSLGQAVFDGNVQVNREAQQTDAGQLTRSLLLEPRATVNVKPNLQIIADDVKCSHGAAISDLEENQLFYFQARGVDLQAARKALIFSFAAEVIERFPNTSIQKKAESYVKKLLDPKLSS